MVDHWTCLLSTYGVCHRQVTVSLTALGFLGSFGCLSERLDSQVASRRQVLVASPKPNSPSRVLAHCSEDWFVKQRTTCILQEDELRAVSCVATVYIHEGRVIPSHSSGSRHESCRYGQKQVRDEVRVIRLKRVRKEDDGSPLRVTCATSLMTGFPCSGPQRQWVEVGCACM
jgi:hypothetical protein